MALHIDTSRARTSIGRTADPRVLADRVLAPATRTRGGAAKVLAAILAAMSAMSAGATDGCLVMLCLAAPSWSAIEQCVAPIRSLLDDLAHGRPFPSCADAGADNVASNRWSDPPTFCPPQYTFAVTLESATQYVCRYVGAIEVEVAGELWTRTWWSMSGETVTEYTPVAEAGLGSWDRQFEDDYARWLAAQPPAAPACAGC